MSLDESQQQIQRLEQMIADSKTAVEQLKSIILDVESRLRDMGVGPEPGMGMQRPSFVLHALAEPVRSRSVMLEQPEVRRARQTRL